MKYINVVIYGRYWWRVNKIL